MQYSMRVVAGYILLMAVLIAESRAAGPYSSRAIPAPVRLPPVHSARATPIIVEPISLSDFGTFAPAPVVDLDLGLPKGPRTTVGGWISVGYQGGALGQ